MEHVLAETKEIEDRENLRIQQGPGQNGPPLGESASGAASPELGLPGVPRNIAVIRGGAIGDFVVTVPAIETLRLAGSPARLTLIGNPQILGLARADRVLRHDSAILAPLYAETGPLPPETERLFRDMDVVLAYAVDPQGVLERRLGSVVQGELILHDPRPDPCGSRHITEHLLEPLCRRGMPVADSSPRLAVPEEGRASAARAWRRHHLGPAVVAIHPGSGGRHKCWPAACYLALVEELCQRGVQTLLLGGPAEESLLVDLEPRLPSGCAAWRPGSLAELAGMLAQSALFVGNDSGPAHLAAAVGTATLTLFGPTDPQVWRPRAPGSRYVRAPGGDWTALDVDSVLPVALECLPER